ncbi:glutaredoxin [Paenibacillus chondroitinus]|uniref:Glutaredoxin n=1 Tax=Paenibacillus chondroitinus TaxID=59842 RepID=A0ABU6DN54_9BACL|nr:MULTISPECIES: glutaredoxin [Paenibacillus]MCY9657125.1 glutaredoxin [Paenibacillus anseongense]MEB4798408.1 glutaredoxin [Paenibacillus chondroitinus]
MAKVEVFIAGTYLCDAMVKQVKELACSKCDVVIYGLDQCSTTAENESIAKSYGIHSIPSVVINGEVIDVEKMKIARLNGLSKIVRHD